MTEILNVEELATMIIEGKLDISGLENKATVEELAALVKYESEQIGDVDVPWRETEEYKTAAAEAKVQRASIGEAHVGNGNLIDSAFVIGSDKVDDDDEEFIGITKEYKAVPDEGEHKVVLREYPERIAGRGGQSDYRIFSFVEKSTGKCWTQLVSESELGTVINNINYENCGLIANKAKEMNKRHVLSLLGREEFMVWTVKKDNGKPLTYFSEKAMSKFLYVRSKRQEKEELKTPDIEKELPWKI